MKALDSLKIAGKSILPLIEGGKGIAVSNGESAGAWAAAGGIGTFSAVNADIRDAQGNLLSTRYNGKTRRDRHNELINYAIQGGISQAKIAYERSSGQGLINMNVLWEMGAVEPILTGVLSKVKDLVHGVTCGAGMPYKLAEICAHYKVNYYPIVSSARAFGILWKRAYSRFSDWLGGVVYEDPWLAGGHNGLSNSEDPLKPESPFPRVIELRRIMNTCGLTTIPIIMAGGVWCLSEWQDWIDNPEIGPIAFQFGTRPLLTQESPISPAWKQKLLTLKAGDVFLNKFSPTGFYSSAVRNDFITELNERSNRQIPYDSAPTSIYSAALPVGARGRLIYVKPEDREKARSYMEAGYTEIMRTPDSTVVFVTPEKASEILKDQIDCMGCLSACRFSNWAQNEQGTTGKKADPRSFCIQKTLQDISHSSQVENNLMFAGHQAFRFAKDSFYANGFIPTVQQLVARIISGS